MNAFYVPALAGMIYAMPGMETQLHAVMNLPGEYEGFSSNYSGAGFSGMRFRFHGLNAAGFDSLGRQTRAATATRLGRAEYLALAEPSEKVPPRALSARSIPTCSVAIVNRCVEEGRMCIDEMMSLDGARRHRRERGAQHRCPPRERQASAIGHAPFYVGELCTAADSIARVRAGQRCPAHPAARAVRGSGAKHEL